jgi:hypothetical protein
LKITTRGSFTMSKFGAFAKNVFLNSNCFDSAPY